MLGPVCSELHPVALQHPGTVLIMGHRALVLPQAIVALSGVKFLMIPF